MMLSPCHYCLHAVKICFLPTMHAGRTDSMNADYFQSPWDYVGLVGGFVISVLLVPQSEIQPTTLLI